MSLPSTLAEVHVFLEGKAGRELEREFRRVFGAHPQAAMDALVLRAGTPVPPGVTAARAGLRRSMRDDAVRLLEAEVQRSDDSRERWLERLRALLTGEQLVDEDLRCAAMGAVGEVRLYELAREVAAHLDDEFPRYRAAARDCLYQLYRVRFPTRNDFEEAWPRLSELTGDPFFLRELRAEQERARELSLRLIALTPADIFTWLANADPRIRAQAAEALSRFVGEGRVGVPEAIDALLASLEQEVDAVAFHAMLRSLSDLLGSSPPDSPSVTRLRGVLDRVAQRRQRNLYGSIVRALSRLPWSEDPASGEQSLAAGVGRVVDLFSRCVDRGRPLDPDQVLTGIDALETLCLRETPSEEWSELTAPAREALEYLLRDYRGSAEVRIAVAGAYASLLGDDVENMLRLLSGDHDFDALRYALLGALRRVLPGVELDEPLARAVFDTLVQLSSEGEPELRRRAFEVLNGEEFRAHVARVGTLEDATRLVERLEYESDPALRSSLLQLVASFEQPALVERLLLSPFFDEWMRGGPRNISEMATALTRLAQGDPQVVMRSAERLLVDSKWERQADAQLVRLESALSLVATLTPEAAAGLAPRNHATIVGWALELREKGGGRLAGMPRSAEVLQRLVDVHLSGAGNALDQAERAWALLSGDFHLAHPEGISVPEVVGRYRAAAARLDPATVAHALLVRDQARFLFRADRPREALAVYGSLRTLDRTRREALAEDPEALAALRPLFELSDLRDLAGLTAQPGAEGELELRAASRDAFDLGLELVERASWREEPPKVRIQDLRDLAERAQRSQNQPRIARVQAIFRELPESPLEGPLPPQNGAAVDVTEDLEGPLWSGLVRRDDWHRALLEVKAKVLATETAPTEASSPPPADPRSTLPLGGAESRAAPGSGSPRRSH